MRNKISLIVLIMAVITVYWLNLHDKGYGKKLDDPHEVAIEQGPNNDVQLNQQNDDLDDESEPLSTDKVADKSRRAIIEVFSQNRFSDDPLIEAMIIGKVGFDCAHLYQFTHRSSIETPPENQSNTILAFKDRCDQHEETYGHLKETQFLTNPQEVLMTLASESEYLDLIQRGMAMKFMDKQQKVTFFHEFIITILKTRNAHAIAAVPELLNEDDSQHFINELSNQLGMINHRYVRQISAQAIVLFACQFNSGEVCSADSYYMFKQCMQYTSACGLDVRSWFREHYTSAHNKDIQQLLAFFNAQYH